MAIVRSRRQSRLSGWARYAALLVAALLFLIPFYLLVRSAFMREQDLSSPDFHWLPPVWETSNLTGLFDNPAIPMARSLLNSGDHRGDADDRGARRLRSRGLRPGAHPLPVVQRRLLRDHRDAAHPGGRDVRAELRPRLDARLDLVAAGLIVPGLFQALATFLFRQFFLGFPKEVEEAAFIDGLGYWGTFWRIVVPNSLGFVAAIGTITFIGSWNAFLWPLVIGRDQESWTVQIALSTFLTAQSVQVSQLFMAALVAIVPLLLMFLFLQRWIVEGVERTGIAGD